MEWISVHKGYPLEYVPVLVLNLSIKTMGISYFNGIDWFRIDDEFGEPTHWCPIPEIPSQVVKKKRMRKIKS